MNRKSHNYGKFWLDPCGPLSRSEAYTYWEQASRFERQARERGDKPLAKFQGRVRVQYENRLIELDAMEGGNI